MNPLTINDHTIQSIGRIYGAKSRTPFESFMLLVQPSQSGIDLTAQQRETKRGNRGRKLCHLSKHMFWGGSLPNERRNPEWFRVMFRFVRWNGGNISGLAIWGERPMNAASFTVICSGTWTLDKNRDKTFVPAKITRNLPHKISPPYLEDGPRTVDKKYGYRNL